MTDVSLNFEVVVDAPVHTVFEYCRDPRRIYAGDPMHDVTDATLSPEAVGTRAQVVAQDHRLHRQHRDRVRRPRPGPADRRRRPPDHDHQGAGTMTRVFSKEVSARLARIEASAEKQGAPTR